jgi:hypothetical protein
MHLQYRKALRQWSAKDSSDYRKNLEILLPFFNEEDPGERLQMAEAIGSSINLMRLSRSCKTHLLIIQATMHNLSKRSVSKEIPSLLS